MKNEECPQVAPNAGHGLSRSWHYAWVRAVLLLLAVIGYLSVYYRGPVPLKRSFAMFPSTIGLWVEARDRERPLLRAVGSEDELHRIYVGAGKRRLHLYVGYFEYQRQGKEAAGHLMAPFHQSAQILSLNGNQLVVGVDEKFAGSSFENCNVLFWYDINGRILADRLTAKASTIWDALTRGRTNGALVMVYREREHGIAQESNYQDLTDFAAEVLPILRNYLP